MKQFPQNELDVLLDILEKYEQELKDKGAHYVDVGYKFKAGKQEDRLAIRVHVLKKIKPKSAVDASKLIPEELEGYPTDVIQSKPEILQPSEETTVNWRDRNQRFSILVGGIAVWNPRYHFPGTLGAVVFDVNNNFAPMGLTNHHVFVRDMGHRGDIIKQGDINMYPPNPNDVIGTLDRWDTDLDCAVCTLTLNNGREISRSIKGYPDRPGGSDRPTGVIRPSVGMRVTKSGISTGVTYGIVDGISRKEFTVIPDSARPAPNGEISIGGDSGSLWLEVDSFNAVGLHCRGENNTRNPEPNDERAWAKRMDKVVKKLNIVFEPVITSKQSV